MSELIRRKQELLGQMKDETNQHKEYVLHLKILDLTMAIDILQEMDAEDRENGVNIHYPEIQSTIFSL